MAKIRIKDLAAGTKLDKDILKKIHGGTTFRIDGGDDKSVIIVRSCTPYDADGDGWISWEENEWSKTCQESES